MYHVRAVTTSSGATAVQIVRYEQRKRIIVKHIGSAHNTSDIESLKKIACKWIDSTKQKETLFPSEDIKSSSNLVALDKVRNLGFRYTFMYEIILKLLNIFDLPKLDSLIIDMIIMRIIQPASKIESIELIHDYFGIKHNRTDFYRLVQTMTMSKQDIESSIMAVAEKYFSFDFKIVFYDVTTLYFESFKSDLESFRKPGFSKDNKSNQPQIVVGLIVTGDGFPVAYELFPGNTFEGKTFIPTICQFKDKYNIRGLTVVADAAMISQDNIDDLVGNHLSYIVGARVANLTRPEIKKISDSLSQKDSASIRIDTKRGLLICDFSHKRFQKDKNEMEKQISKAERLLRGGSLFKRSKFIKTSDSVYHELNTELVEKTKQLLGIKGYYTNMTSETDEAIIRHYHNLWHVEQAFRIAKSDLAMRPIYHYKKQSIEAHILICFIALSVCKYIELRTGKSIKSIIKLLKKITDARLLNTTTNEEILIRSEINRETQEVVKLLDLPH